MSHWACASVWSSHRGGGTPRTFPPGPTQAPCPTGPPSEAPCHHEADSPGALRNLSLNRDVSECLPATRSPGRRQADTAHRSSDDRQGPLRATAMERLCYRGIAGAPILECSGPLALPTLQTPPPYFQMVSSPQAQAMLPHYSSSRRHVTVGGTQALHPWRGWTMCAEAIATGLLAHSSIPKPLPTRGKVSVLALPLLGFCTHPHLLQSLYQRPSCPLLHSAGRGTCL